MTWNDVLIALLKAFSMVMVVMTIAGYAVLAERKVAAWIQGRPGPNRTRVMVLGHIPVIGDFLTRLGIFQPLADIGKFGFKEDIVPGHVRLFYYFLAPAVAFIPAMTTMTVLPFGQYTNEAGETVPMVLANLDIGILFILAVSSLGVYGIILAGWAANSKYPFLGGIRGSAQMISYELAMGLALIPVFLWTGGTLNLFQVVEHQSAQWFGWTLFFQPISAFIFLVALFAETNRQPFDMPESETDLVSGYNVEYGAFKFGLFFVGEYTHMIIGSAVFVVLFMGGWSLWPLSFFLEYPAGVPGAVLSVLVFMLKTFVLIFLFMWVRWTIPRFRYDQVMEIGWKKLLPLAVINLIVYASLIALLERPFWEQS